MWSKSVGGLARERSKLAKVVKIPAQESAPKLGGKMGKMCKKAPNVEKKTSSLCLHQGQKQAKSPQKGPKWMKRLPRKVSKNAQNV